MRSLFLLLLLSELLFAHRLNLFAYREDQGVVVNAYFASGTPCKGCAVTIRRGDRILVRGETDGEGMAFLPLNEKESVEIFVDGGSGHGATSQLGGEAPSQDLPASAANTDPKELEALVGRVVEAKLRPLIAQTARREESPLERILCGLGYLLGVFGLWMFWKRR